MLIQHAILLQTVNSKALLIIWLSINLESDTQSFYCAALTLQCINYYCTRYKHGEPRGLPSVLSWSMFLDGSWGLVTDQQESLAAHPREEHAVKRLVSRKKNLLVILTSRCDCIASGTDQELRLCVLKERKKGREEGSKSVFLSDDPMQSSVVDLWGFCWGVWR